MNFRWFCRHVDTAKKNIRLCWIREIFHPSFHIPHWWKWWYSDFRRVFSPFSLHQIDWFVPNCIFRPIFVFLSQLMSSFRFCLHLPGVFLVFQNRLRQLLLFIFNLIEAPNAFHFCSFLFTMNAPVKLKSKFIYNNLPIESNLFSDRRI